MDTIPNEVVLDIFGNLTYWDLKYRVPLVCKRFHVLISRKTKTGKIDKILFRDLLEEDDKENIVRPETTYTIHLMLTRIAYRAETPESVGTILFPGEDGTLRRPFHSKTSACSLRIRGNAVSPAVGVLTCKIRKFAPDVDDFHDEDYHGIERGGGVELKSVTPFFDGLMTILNHHGRLSLELEKIEVVEGRLTLLYDWYDVKKRGSTVYPDGFDYGLFIRKFMEIAK